MTLFRACQNPPYARPDRHFVFAWIFVVSSFLFKKEDLAVITPRPVRILAVREVCVIFREQRGERPSSALSTNVNISSTHISWPAFCNPANS